MIMVASHFSPLHPPPHTPPLAYTILNKAQIYTNRIWLVIVLIFTPNSYKVNNDKTHLNMMETGGDLGLSLPFGMRGQFSQFKPSLLQKKIYTDIHLQCGLNCIKVLDHSVPVL